MPLRYRAGVGFESLLTGWDGEHAVVRHDPESGAWMFVCVHSTVRGPAGGGTRMRVYPAPADGLADAMRLSGAMTWKMAAAGMPRGGGKAVLAVPELPSGEPRRRLLRRYGELVASLGGSYRTAGDMNISPEDLDVVAETCPWVYGTTRGGGNSGRGTARGALHAIRATVEHAFGSPELAGRSVLVQGAGSVGAVLARELAAAGARILVSDVDEQRAAATGFETVPPEHAVEAEVDVYSPCAVGGDAQRATRSRASRCRAIAGCANNQLAEPEDCRAATRARHPLRARLRRQRRRHRPADRARGRGLGRDATRRAPRRHRRHASLPLHGSRDGRHHAGRRRRPARTPAPGRGARIGPEERDLEELVLAAEDRRDGVVGEDVHDRLGEQARDAEDGHVVGAPAEVDRDRVGDDDAVDVGLADLLEGVVGEESVRDEDVDLGRALLLQRRARRRSACRR